MGIRFRCPACDKKIHVKDFLAGKRGICPKCDAGVDIPLVSQLPPSLKKKSRNRAGAEGKQREARTPATSSSHAPPGRLLGMTELPTVDPLVESPGRGWYVAAPDGREVGPLPAGDVRGMIEAGDIRAESSVRREDWPQRLVAAAVWPHWKGADPFAAPPSTARTPAGLLLEPDEAMYEEVRADDDAGYGPPAPVPPSPQLPPSSRLPDPLPPGALPAAVDSPTMYLPPAVGRALLSGMAGTTSTPNSASPPAHSAPQAPFSEPPPDSAAPEAGLYYPRGSNAAFVAAIAILILVVVVVAVAAYHVIVDPPAWLRPQQSGGNTANQSIVAIEPSFPRNHQ